MTKTDLKQYHIYVTHKREITKWEDLKIDITIRLTDQEKKLMDRQQLQVNESVMLETGWAKTISYTHMIEHIIKEETDTPTIEEKIFINAESEADKVALEEYFKFLLWQTEKNILKQEKSDDVLYQAKEIQKEIDNK